MFAFVFSDLKVIYWAFHVVISCFEPFPGGAVIKEPPASTGDSRGAGSVPGSGSSPGGGHGNPLQYSCLENSMNRRSWQTIVHGISESDTTVRTCARTHTHTPVVLTFLK